MDLESTDQFEEVACPLCGSKSYDTLYTSGKFNIELNQSVCTSCGLGYLNPRWTKERYQYFYEHEYDSYFRSAVKEQESEAFKYGTVKVVVKRLLKQEAISDQNKAILDVGSGMGWSLDHIRKNIAPNADLFAIEPSEHCRKHLKEKSIEVVSDDVDSDWAADHQSKFDLIIMRHVLEHFMDPVSVLEKLRGCLTENGKIYIAVPNAGHPGVPFTSNFIRVVHTFSFTRNTLLGVLKRAGLSASFVGTKDPDNMHEIFVVAERSSASRSFEADASEAQRLKDTFKRFESIESNFALNLLFKLNRRIRKIF